MGRSGDCNCEFDCYNDLLLLSEHTMSANLTYSFKAPVTISFSTLNSGGTAPYTYLWTFPGNVTYTTPTATHKFTHVGVDVVTVVVTDSTGLTTTETIPITVT